jgi:hypothetical protein
MEKNIAERSEEKDNAEAQRALRFAEEEGKEFHRGH